MQEKNNTIFSIGHGNKTIEEFILELKSFDIQYLIDVRSIPYSKYNTQFNKEELKEYVEEEGIKYIYLGDILGGLPKDKSCYTEGKVDYKKLKEKTSFKEGLQRLKKANEQKINVCIMCSETNPKECHRSKVIGVELENMGIGIRHIISKDKEKSQKQVILEATKGLGVNTLFGEETLLSKKKHL